MLYVNPLVTSGTNVAGKFESGAAREKTAVREMEQLFIFQLMREMRKSVPKNSLFGSPREKEMFEEMLDDAMSKEMSVTGQIGLAKQMEEQLRIAAMQEKVLGQMHAE